MKMPGKATLLRMPKRHRTSAIAVESRILFLRHHRVILDADLSQLYGVTAGTRWEVPPGLYSPIRQDAVLLKTGADSEASKAFLDFLKGPEARAIIERFGYALN